MLLNPNSAKNFNIFPERCKKNHKKRLSIKKTVLADISVRRLRNLSGELRSYWKHIALRKKNASVRSAWKHGAVENVVVQASR